MIITYQIVLYQAQYGYFDLIVDTSEVDLAVKYTVTATLLNTNEIADCKIIGYSFPGQIDTITYLNDSNTEVQGSVAAEYDSSTIRIYVSWDDNEETESLNDTQDTSIALNSGKSVIQANVSFEQLIN